MENNLQNLDSIQLFVHPLYEDTKLKLWPILNGLICPLNLQSFTVKTDGFDSTINKQLSLLSETIINSKTSQNIGLLYINKSPNKNKKDDLIDINGQYFILIFNCNTDYSNPNTVILQYIGLAKLYFISRHINANFYWGKATLQTLIYDVINPEVEIENIITKVKKIKFNFDDMLVKYADFFVEGDSQRRLEAYLAIFINLVVNINPQDVANIMQEFLGSPSLMGRLNCLHKIINYLIYISSIDLKINEKLNMAFMENSKEMFLREKIKQIKLELNEDDKLEKELETKNLSPEAYQKVKRELSRLAKFHSSNPESEICRNYIEKIYSLPWGKVTPMPSISLAQIKKELDSWCYGLEEIKEEIVELIAIYRRNLELSLSKDKKKLSNTKMPIICLVGAPGVGKTSIAKAIAQVLRRETCHIALGGVNDVHEIRGHRRTYLGSTTGVIIEKLIMAKCDNPVFILDEIDKLGSYGNSNQVESALLELLDPQQNNKFRDNFLDIEYDLSQAIFIGTANNADGIMSALYNRMHIINIRGYTNEEKIAIVKLHLIPRIENNFSLKPNQITLSNAVINFLIERYTFEAGVRELDRLITKLFRFKAYSLPTKGEEAYTKGKITLEDVKLVIKRVPYNLDKIAKKSTVGLINGLSYCMDGVGGVIPIEVLMVPGDGKLHFTGNIGKIMRESSQLSFVIARNYVIKNFPEFKINEYDINIHFISGATPKEGPSAGCAIFLAIVSAYLNKPIKPFLAMTGEITLHGRVLAIGGLQEKIQGAYLNGIKDVYIPADNSIDLNFIDKKILAKVNIHFLKNMFLDINNFFDAKVTTQ